MRNPDKYIRRAFYARLSSLGLQVFDKAIPKSFAQPVKYVLISSQTKLDEKVSRDCGYWDCTIVLDLNCIQPLSYVNSEELDDYEEQVLNAFKQGTSLAIENFQLLTIRMDGTPRDLSHATDTQQVLRKVVTYRLRVRETELVNP